MICLYGRSNSFEVAYLDSVNGSFEIRRRSRWQRYRNKPYTSGFFGFIGSTFFAVLGHNGKPYLRIDDQAFVLDASSAFKATGDFQERVLQIFRGNEILYTFEYLVEPPLFTFDAQWDEWARDFGVFLEEFFEAKEEALRRIIGWSVKK